jgi:hypothetical protein
MKIKLKNEIVLLWLFLVFLMVAGCKKTSEPGHSIISDDMKSWYLYQQGSYWIFENNKSSKTDCTFINKEPLFWQENLYKDDGSLRAIIDHFVISYNGNIFQFCGIDPEEVELNVQEADHLPMFYTNITVGRKYSDYYDVFEYVSHYDSIQIADHYFKDVRKTKFSCLMSDNSPDSFAVTFFVAKNIGIISLNKVIAGIDTTWNVIRYHAVQ